MLVFMPFMDPLLPLSSSLMLFKMYRSKTMLIRVAFIYLNKSVLLVRCQIVRCAKIKFLNWHFCCISDEVNYYDCYNHAWVGNFWWSNRHGFSKCISKLTFLCLSEMTNLNTLPAEGFPNALLKLPETEIFVFALFSKTAENVNFRSLL